MKEIGLAPFSVKRRELRPRRFDRLCFDGLN
jgi:hypothetical protein